MFWKCKILILSKSNHFITFTQISPQFCLKFNQFCPRMFARGQGRRQKNFQGRGGKWKNQDREIAPISLPLLISGELGAQWSYTQAHLRRTLHQEPRVKLKTFFWETPISVKVLIFLENFRPFSCKKNFISRSPLSLNHPCLLTSTNKELRWLMRVMNVLTEWLLVEKHISGIMCENSCKKILALLCLHPCKDMRLHPQLLRHCSWYSYEKS